MGAACVGLVSREVSGGCILRLREARLVTALQKENHEAMFKESHPMTRTPSRATT